MIIIAYFGLIFLWIISEFFADLFQEISFSTIENNTRLYFIGEIYKLKPKIIKEYNTGYINGLTQQHIRRKCDIYAKIVLFAPLSFIYVIYAIYQICMYHLVYGITLLIILTIAIIYKVSLNSVKEGQELTEAEGQRDKRFIDSISNINTIQKMQSLSFIRGKLKEAADECMVKTIKWSKKNELSFTGYKCIVYLYLPIVCLIYHLYPDLVDDKMEFFSFLSIICVQIVHTAKDLANSMIAYGKFKANTIKIDNIIKEENFRQGYIDSNEFRTAQIMNVEYEYEDKGRQITTTVKIPLFNLQKGDKVCIYGESGQGKTTLLNILSGELESEGVIINGKETNKRLECVFIAQDTEILDLSLRDNLTLGNRNISDEEILILLDKCGLMSWYKNQKDGLDTMLGERGVFVSTGQRQRLNLIRGLLIKDKEVYLLDEPTSNVDEQTEAKMIDIIKEYLNDKTAIIVTHRPTIKQICNKGYKFEHSVLGHAEDYSQK
jgi:ATP-binding cassette subfamily C protein